MRAKIDIYMFLLTVNVILEYPRQFDNFVSNSCRCDVIHNIYICVNPVNLKVILNFISFNIIGNHGNVK